MTVVVDRYLTKEYNCLFRPVSSYDLVVNAWTSRILAPLILATSPSYYRTNTNPEANKPLHN